MHKQTLPEVLTRAAAQCGFLSMADVATIAENDRLRQILVRCGNGRFTCPAQDVAHFYRCVTAGGDYVRDCSLPVNDPAMRTPAAFKASAAAADAKPAPTTTTDTGREGIGSSRGIVRTYNPRVGTHTPVAFREEDCGGVFDGFNVTSDADPGL